MAGVVNSRRTAAFIFAKWLATKDFPAAMLPDGPDRAFVQDLVYTTIRRLRPLRRILGMFLKTWPKGELEALLYIGAAQILYMTDVPDFAAVSATVDAAKASPNRNLAKVVNGVLRNLIRKRDEGVDFMEGALLEERESFPTALVKRWIDRYGRENAEKLCQWHNEPAETWIARPPRPSADTKARSEHGAHGVFLKLERGEKVESVKGFKEGEFIVQDPGTQLAVELMDVKPGEAVLDACAAPGGKTIQLAWRGAKVTACEVNPRRRCRLQENLARVHVDVEVIPELPNSCSTSQLLNFSKILVDAPCSNTGVLRRRPDARWNWSEEKLKELVKLQAEILDQVVPLVAPGGSIVYSTCSNEPEENLEQVRSFTRRHKDFHIVTSKESIPFETGHDGAFAARIERDRL